MAEKMVVSLCIDSSLLDYFVTAGGDGVKGTAEDSLVNFLASFLDDTSYPLAARRTGDREILLSYQLKAFSDPIF